MGRTESEGAQRLCGLSVEGMTVGIKDGPADRVADGATVRTEEGLAVGVEDSTGVTVNEGRTVGFAEGSVVGM